MNAVSFKSFADVLFARLERDGYIPIRQRLLTAGEELHKLRFRGLAKVSGGKTFVVSAVHADEFKRDQLRYLSDQFCNALELEKNALVDDPTKVRGVCLFTYEGEPPVKEVPFLLGQSRQGNPLGRIQSTIWVVDLGKRRIEKPFQLGRPFEDSYLVECMDEVARS